MRLQLASPRTQSAPHNLHRPRQLNLRGTLPRRTLPARFLLHSTRSGELPLQLPGRHLLKRSRHSRLPAHSYVANQPQEPSSAWSNLRIHSLLELQASRGPVPTPPPEFQSTTTRSCLRASAQDSESTPG